MKPRRLPWKRLLLLLVGICLIGIGLLPWLIGDTSAFGDRVAAKLERWTGGEVRLTGPVALRYFPNISINSGLEMRNPKSADLPAKMRCENVRIALSLPHLLLGRLVVKSVNLTQPEMTFEQTSPAGPEGWHRAEAGLVKLLGKRPFHVLRIEDGTVRLTSPTGNARIEHLSLKLDLGDEGERTDGYGSFIWKGEPVRFTYETGLDAETIRTASSDGPVPLNITVESAPFTATLEGVGHFRPDFEMEGNMTAAIADLRGFLRWVGLAELEGLGLQDISVAGDFRTNDKTLIFEEGRYSADGNAATGLLAVGFGGARPRLEATLAFDTLDLNPYLGPAVPENEMQTEDSPEETGAVSALVPSPSSPPAGNSTDGTPAGPIFDWPLVKLADADLRFSAGTISVRDLQLEGGAFTLAAQDGVVIGDIADLEICGGVASTRFTIDITAPTRNADLSGSLEEIDIAPCLQLFALDMPVQGRVGFKGQLKTSGQSWSDFLHRMTGDMELEAKNGSLPVDIGSLMSEDVPIEKVGWATVPATNFGRLNASCRMAAAQIWCQRFSMETPQGPVSGSGRIDFASNSLNWDVLLPTELTSRKAQASAQVLRKVIIRGPLGEPVISRDLAPVPADRSLGAPTSSQPIIPN